MRASSTGPGVVLELIRSGEATTRSDLIERLGWSRVTLARRLDELMSAGLVASGGQQGSRGGRPPQELAVAADAGVLLSIDIGGSHSRVGITDLVSNVLSEDEADIGHYDGPHEVFSWAVQVFDFLLARIGRGRDDVRAVGVGVPGPVDPATGILGSPQHDARWDGVRVADHLGDYRDAVVAVDRDVNILAVGEQRLAWPDFRDLLVLKVGMGVGLALIGDGRVYHGSRGGAGELSAPRSGRSSDPLRRLETVASGRVIRDRLAESGISVQTSSDIVALAAGGDATTLSLLDETGEVIGAALADAVALLNPSALVIGGNLADAGDRFLGAIRAGVLGTTHPYSRRGLIIERSRLGAKAGVRGASLLAQDALFAVERVDAMVRAGRRIDTPEA